MTGGEQFWYIMWNICTLGMPYLFKIVIKQATLEAMVAHDRQMYQAQLQRAQYPAAPQPGAHRQIA